MRRVEFDLTPERPYSLSKTVARLVRFTTLVDRMTDDGEYSRCLHLKNERALIRVSQVGPPSRATLRVTLHGEHVRNKGVREHADRIVRRSLGAGCKLAPFYQGFRNDPLLADSVRAHHGMALCGGATLFEAMVTSILAQQVNLKFAYSIYDELTNRYGETIDVEGETRVAFPRPARLARVCASTFHNMRLTKAKSGTIVRIARAFAQGELDEDKLCALPDEDVIEQLVAYKGIGRWTAETSLIRGLGRLDVFPAGDLGVVKKIAIDMLGRSSVASESEMRDFSERWRPYRSLALIYAYAVLYADENPPLRFSDA